ncbi:hypothetical protein [Deinococcus aerophilus]|uniref:Uncharacterized protein n=1 Tax=Deinococcus aerophilus TaxID=522488 RepID=A0ABQ2GUZ1_9DEIO|nr:hypothetical protein [Deinococcus aerophilus]GGM13208.1 hypothetical protein GCM10010841_22280 [Deinococcus aerophilus]
MVDALRQNGAAWEFRAFSWISAGVCGPGTLSFSARGDAAEGAGAELQVNLDGQELLNQHFTMTQTMTMNVPAAGKLVLAFTNDLIVRDTEGVFTGNRNLFVSDLIFTARPLRDGL